MVGVLVLGGHDPEDFMGWSDTKFAVAAASALKVEAWKVEQIAKALSGGK